MLQKKYLIVLILSLIILSTVFSQEAPNKDLLVQNNNQFAFELYKQIRAEEGNIVFFPYSISIAMAMVYGGASGNTSEQMAEVMNFILDDNQFHKAFLDIQNKLNFIEDGDNIQLDIANSLWPQTGYLFLPEYLELLETYYQVDIIPIDYISNPDNAMIRINDWTSENTNGRIPEILNKPLDPLTVFMVLNAVYFKGTWLSEFDKSATTEELFYLDEDNYIEVPMMSQQNVLKYGWLDNVELLELPYTGNNLSMVIVLSRDINEFQLIEGQLNADQFNIWCQSLFRETIMVYLPRFLIMYDLPLKSSLINMGMEDLFIRNTADLSGINGNPESDLHIKICKHSAFIEVNEQGTEAAAVTAVGCFPAGQRYLQ